jgi:hypothetical protein
VPVLTGEPVRTPLLERLGVGYFRRLSSAFGPVDAGDGVHFLNPKERKALAEVVRGAVTRACIAGALSGGASALAEILARPVLGPEPDLATYGEQVEYWGILGGVTAVASVIEIAFLYWDGLRSVHRLSLAAGLDLFPEAHVPEEAAVANAMARAALELPNPSHELFGIDPMREASKLGAVVASVVYKAKISASNFLLKLVVRRFLGRALVRAWVPLVAVPVTAAWNGVVAWLVQREARVRAMGPSAAKEMVDVLFSRGPALSREGGAAAARAVAASIVRTRDLHPNLVALLLEVQARVGDVDTHAISDARLFLDRLRALAPEEQRVVLQLLGVASILDGRLTKPERRLLGDARAATGRPRDLTAVFRLRRAFLRGDAVSPEMLEALA